MSDSRVNGFKIGDKVVGRIDGKVYTVAHTLGKSIALNGLRGLYHAAAYDLYTETKPTIDVYTTQELAYIEELEDEVNRLNDLCSDYMKIIEDKDAEIEKLRGITINSNSVMKTDFKPISEMTIEDWQQALDEGWEFEDNEGDVCGVISVDRDEQLVAFDGYIGKFDISGRYCTKVGYKYYIANRIK